MFDCSVLKKTRKEAVEIALFKLEADCVLNGHLIYKDDKIIGRIIAVSNMFTISG